MSTTIGFGFICSGQDSGLIREVAEFIDHHEYGYSLGTDGIEEDAREGVLQTSAALGWGEVLILRSPADAKANLAFGIHQELQRQLQGETPRFFALLRDIAACVDHHKCDVDVFFCSEWCRDDRVRGSAGTIEQLITILSLPGHWCQLYLKALKGRVVFQESDEDPFVFRLDRKP